ncbi:UbiA family prenyltransferase [Aurantimonas sp. Leaf443]|uniref:UbiA family prenyltransferase n=1 Tax=Aurantimonas sp. Leaf443 TaxID=1736378 RepID=UPI0006F93252|nr:UbiA family prenyltransferase [Aurantimonas sp. Leaf443]KQT86139.1 prenyltransferase [Aurantimonas sp. Leaf443]
MDILAIQADRTVYVDLDGTLIRSDLLWETLFLAARQRPDLMARVPFWTARGKAYLKARLAESVEFDAALLPYRTEVVEALRVERERGRRIVLATGANERLADAVAAHLGLFDAVMASSETVNLTAEAKLARIEAECGDKGFDYYGNSHEDVCLLDKAVEPIVVAPDRAVHRWHGRTGSARIDETPGQLKALAKTMRPHQWAKNVLVFVPTVLMQEYLDPGMLFACVLAFLSFSFAASSVYILNDLLDLDADRRHRTKRHRPFASGRVPIPHGLALGLGLFLSAFAIALLLPPGFGAILAAYMVATTAYSFFLKRMLLIDVLTLAGLYTVRIIAGGSAAGVEISFWLLAFSIFFFLSLALVKRFTELQDFGTGATRSSTGRGYVDADMETLAQAGIASGFASVLVLALYIDSFEVAQQYSEPYLVWPLCPLVLYLIVRIWILARRNEMHEDPVVFIMRDWRSQAMIAAGGLMFLLAAYV